MFDELNKIKFLKHSRYDEVKMEKISRITYFKCEKKYKSDLIFKHHYSVWVWVRQYIKYQVGYKPSYIYSCSISHIWEHEFVLGHLGSSLLNWLILLLKTVFSCFHGHFWKKNYIVLSSIKNCIMSLSWFVSLWFFDLISFCLK